MIGLVKKKAADDFAVLLNRPLCYNLRITSYRPCLGCRLA